MEFPHENVFCPYGSEGNGYDENQNSPMYGVMSYPGNDYVANLAAAVAEANANSRHLGRDIPTDYTVELMDDHTNQYVAVNKAAPWYDPVLNKIYVASNPRSHCQVGWFVTDNRYPNIEQGQKLCHCSILSPPPTPPPPSPPANVADPGFWWTDEGVFEACSDVCHRNSLVCQDDVQERNDHPLGELFAAFTWVDSSNDNDQSLPSTWTNNPPLEAKVLAAVQKPTSTRHRASASPTY